MNNAGRGFLKAIIIVGLLFLVAYYFSYNKWLDHDFNSVDITYRYNDEENNTTNTTTKDVSSDFKEKYSNMNYELFQTYFGEQFYDVFYKKGNFSDEFYIYLGVINFLKNDISSTVNCNYSTEINATELKDKVTSLVGNVSYTDKSFTTSNGYLTISYNQGANNYAVKLNDKCAGLDFSKGGIMTVYDKATTDDEYLYIYEKALYMKSKADSKGNIINEYHNDISENSKVIANIYENIDKNQLPTYIFKYKINGNTYTLESIRSK